MLLLQEKVFCWLDLSGKINMQHVSVSPNLMFCFHFYVNVDITLIRVYHS